MTEQRTTERLADAMAEARYGRTKVAKIKAAYDELRDACRAEGTPRIQDAIDRYEQWADYVMGASEADGGWRDIETAPKDGTAVLLLIDGKAIEGAWQEWAEDWRPVTLDSHGCGCCASDDPPATNWMPLTAPPASERNE